MQESMLAQLAQLAESRCAIAVRSAIWARTGSAYLVLDERRGLEELDGVIKIKRWRSTRSVYNNCIGKGVTAECTGNGRLGVRKMVGQ